MAAGEVKPTCKRLLTQVDDLSEAGDRRVLSYVPGQRLTHLSYFGHLVVAFARDDDLDYPFTNNRKRTQAAVFDPNTGDARREQGEAHT